MARTRQRQRCISAVHSVAASAALALGTMFVLGVLGTLPAQAQTETVLHAFNGKSGRYPQAGVIRSSAGDIYGTAAEGGPSNYGIVFKLDRTGKETVLYSFKGAPDGGFPAAV
jgi:uncharacterized repeat protein (TIGR03803 family)